VATARCGGRDQETRHGRQVRAGLRGILPGQFDFGPTYQRQRQFPLQALPVHPGAQVLVQFHGPGLILPGLLQLAQPQAHGAPQEMGQRQVALHAGVPALVQSTLQLIRGLLGMPPRRIAPSPGADQDVTAVQVEAGGQLEVRQGDRLANLQGRPGLGQGLSLAAQFRQSLGQGPTPPQADLVCLPQDGRPGLQLRGLEEVRQSGLGVPVGQTDLAGTGQDLADLPGQKPDLGSLRNPGLGGRSPVGARLLDASNRLA